jgi:hypothetical protein
MRRIDMRSGIESVATLLAFLGVVAVVYLLCSYHLGAIIFR